MASPVPLLFRQLFDRESCTYTYLLGDPGSKQAVLIDPVDQLVDRDLQLVDELGLTLTHVLNTHVHADHITGSALIKQRRPTVKSVLGGGARPASADIYLDHLQELSFGSRAVTAMLTPGHTSGCTSYVLDDSSMVFTGDTLFVRGCGRTDFQQGDSSTLFDSVHTKLFTLPDTCEVFPGHDYKGQTRSTIGEEKAFNPRLTKSRIEFIQLMATLKLSIPSKIDVAVPANMVCGYVVAEPGEILSIDAVTARLRIPGTVVIDVRDVSEHARLPTPDSAICATFVDTEEDDLVVTQGIHAVLGPSKEDSMIIACCRTGVRAGAACKRLLALGFKNAVNGGGAAAVTNAINAV